jgi:hypothetical protein
VEVVSNLLSHASTKKVWFHHPSIFHVDHQGLSNPIIPKIGKMLLIPFHLYLKEISPFFSYVLRASLSSDISKTSSGALTRKRYEDEKEAHRQQAPFVAGEGWEKNEDDIATNSLCGVGRSLPRDGSKFHSNLKVT